MSRFFHVTAALLLAAGTVPLQALPAAAAAEQPGALSEAAAVAKARALLNLPAAEYELDTAERMPYAYYAGLPERSAWWLTFIHDEQETAVSIDAETGRLMHFLQEVEEPSDADEFISPQEARAIGLAFLQKVAPEELKQSTLSKEPAGWGYSYDLVYTRSVNGIPVDDQSLIVTVAWDGSISMFANIWDERLTFPAADKIITQDQARSILADQITMQLGYVTSYEGAPELMYRPYFTAGYTVNATSGKIDPAVDFYYEPQQPASTTPLVQNGPLAPPVLAKELTKAEARKAAESLGLLPADAVYQDTSEQEYEDGEWYLQYEAPGATDQPTDDVTYVIRINAANGELVEFYGYLAHLEFDEEFTPEDELWTDEEPADLLAADELLSRANEHVKTLFPHRTGALTQATTSPDGYFWFHQLVNGLPSDTYVELSLNPSTGSVLEVSQNLIEADYFPQATPAVSAASAKQIFTSLPLELYYGFANTEDMSAALPPFLGYRFEQRLPQYAMIDAQSGQLTGLISKNGTFLPRDIYGHWAEKALTAFADADLLRFDMMNVSPDEPITRGYLIELMIGHLNRNAPSEQTVFYKDVTADHPSYYAINAAANLGWIAKDKNFRPDDPITREEMAILMAKAAGFDPQKHQADALPYADVNQISWWSYGAVAINYKQGWMQGADDNKFHPQGDLTLAEAVSMLFRFKE
ncbi:S-layer family protein [Tumebacillus sp. BK434]|uniref:YcdB/YcdC domain-containing protein n=1 Tax=Tumebacillus sp. BK434 TaxID=2512169 RepID=UPI00104E7723|nr:YcdB/YcdC domain-containing protein [Tumebacillus sp. BK434]TCP53724.1 S-layer family protein [Tumebacillus sp. BK434]